MHPFCTSRRDRRSVTSTAWRSTSAPRERSTRTSRPTPHVERRSRAGWRCSSRSGGASSRCPSGSIIRGGSWIPTSISTSICATSPSRRRATTSNSANRSPASSAVPWTAAGRCGRSMCSRVCRRATSGCSPSSTTPRSTGRPGRSSRRSCWIPSPTPPVPARSTCPIGARESMPSDAELLARTAGQLAKRPIKLVRLQVRALRTLADITRNEGFNVMADIVGRPIPGPVGDGVRRVLNGIGPDEPVDIDAPPPLPAGSAPPTPFNQSITPHRRFAFRSVPLADIKKIKATLGCTVNDVVMAVCAGGLRRYLADHDALPDQPLIAGIPVSIRTGDEDDPWTNRVSSIFAPLPTDLDDPLARVAAVNAAMIGGEGAVRPHPCGSVGRGLEHDPGRPRHPRRTPGHPVPPGRPDVAAHQPDHLQRARSPRVAVHGPGPSGALLPGVDRRRGPGPEHHGAELLRRAWTSAWWPVASWCRTCGRCSTTASTRSTCCWPRRCPTQPAEPAGHRMRVASLPAGRATKLKPGNG